MGTFGAVAAAVLLLFVGTEVLAGYCPIGDGKPVACSSSTSCYCPSRGKTITIGCYNYGSKKYYWLYDMQTGTSFCPATKSLWDAHERCLHPINKNEKIVRGSTTASCSTFKNSGCVHYYSWQKSCKCGSSTTSFSHSSQYLNMYNWTDGQFFCKQTDEASRVYTDLQASFKKMLNEQNAVKKEQQRLSAKLTSENQITRNEIQNMIKRLTLESKSTHLDHQKLLHELHKGHEQ